MVKAGVASPYSRDGFVKKGTYTCQSYPDKSKWKKDKKVDYSKYDLVLKPKPLGRRIMDKVDRVADAAAAPIE